MAQDLNLLVLSGRVGSDPEVKEVGDTELATFSLANDRYMGPDRDPETQWVRVQIWGARAKVADYISKGMKLVVQGKLNINEWEDDEGNIRKDIRLDADHIELPPKSGGSDDGGGSRKSSGRSAGRSGGRDSGKSRAGSGAKKRPSF